MSKLKYLALGDSIATGTLTYFSSTKSYAWHLARALEQYNKSYGGVIYKNMAVDGDSTGRLLWRLSNSELLRNLVSDADIITLSIGGNDLLKAASVPGFTSFDLSMARQSIHKFPQNWEKIIRIIRTLNPTAILLTMTIYNPYCASHSLSGCYLSDRGLHERVEKLLAPINDSILANQEAGYHVVDVYSEFQRFCCGQMGRVVCLYPNPGSYIMRNPHPTPWAHRYIGQLHFDTFLTICDKMVEHAM